MMMPLPSGRRANVSTPAGATAYVAECPNWVRTHTSQCSAILLSVPTPQTSSWRTAMGHAQALGLICSNLTPAQKAATPRADLVALATVFTTFFDAFRRTRAWIRSGVESELSSLLSCTVLIWLEYDTFAAIALESTLGRPTALLASLAAMGAAANPPCEDFMDTFVGCFHNCCTNFHIAKSSLEPLFLCAGVVEQFLRCCSHATNASSFDHVAGVVVIESGLILDQRSVRKNFAASKPAGIALQAAVARVKATTVYSRGKAAKALLKLARSAFVAQAVDRGAGDDEPKTTRMCRYCSGSKKKMNRCKQCGTAYYCDRKCQKADWKQHKKGCRKKAAKGAGGLSNLDHKSHVNMLQRFVNEQQIEIWSRRTVAIERLSGRSDPGQDVPPLAKWIVIIDMAEWKSTGGLREADIRVELTESLIAAFQSDLDVDGGAGDAIVPDWFYRDYKEVYAKNIRRVHADLVEMWAKCTPSQLFFLVRFDDGGGGSGVYRMLAKHPSEHPPPHGVRAQAALVRRVAQLRQRLR